LGEYVDTTNPICTILNNNDDDDYLNPIKAKIQNSFRILDNKNENKFNDKLFYEKF